MKIIKKSSDFKKVYQGNKFYTKAFSVHFIKTKETLPPVFGFTVSKKTVSKKAVIRNLVRRRLKSCVIEHFNIDDFFGYMFVLTAIKSTREAPWSDYLKSIGDMHIKLKKIL